MRELPEQPIALQDARDWSNYERHLAATPLVAKHLGETLRAWVESCRVPNPLAIPWVRILFEDDLSHLEDHLSALEGAMGEESLSVLLGDVLKRDLPTSEIRRDISALFGETMAFRRLKDDGARDLRKITSGGDWLADGTTISVKTILDIDHNYLQVEDSIQGLALLAECPTIRAMRHFLIRKGTGLDYEFMNKVLRFVDRSLEKTLQFLLSGFAYPDWVSACVKVDALRVPGVAGTGESGRLDLVAYRYDQTRAVIQFNDIRSDEPADERTHALELEAELRKGAPLWFSTSNDLNAWYGLPGINRERLGAHITEKLSQIAASRGPDGAADFIAWVNIEAHPSLQQGIAHAADHTSSFLLGLADKMPFPVVFFIYGGFELARPLFVRFDPPCA